MSKNAMKSMLRTVRLQQRPTKPGVLCCQPQNRSTSHNAQSSEAKKVSLSPFYVRKLLSLDIGKLHPVLYFVLYNQTFIVRKH